MAPSNISINPSANVASSSIVISQSDNILPRKIEIANVAPIKIGGNVHSESVIYPISAKK